MLQKKGLFKTWVVHLNRLNYFIPLSMNSYLSTLFQITTLKSWKCNGGNERHRSYSELMLMSSVLLEMNPHFAIRLDFHTKRLRASRQFWWNLRACVRAPCRCLWKSIILEGSWRTTFARSSRLRAHWCAQVPLTHCRCNKASACWLGRNKFWKKTPKSSNVFQ